MSESNSFCLYQHPTNTLRLILPKIYPITEIGSPPIPHLEQVEQMLLGGATLIQIRDKCRSSEDLLGEAKRAVISTNECGGQLIMNDRADIALASGAHGLHLGQDDLSPVYARKLLGDDHLIGYSTHSVEQALNARNEPVDYIAIGPIFPTSTKSRSDPPIGLDGIRAVRDAIGDLPLVAIGGITADLIIPVLEAGADSVAVISEIRNNKLSIEAATRALIKIAACSTG